MPPVAPMSMVAIVTRSDVPITWTTPSAVMTYSRCPSGVAATAVGLSPTGTVSTTARAAVSMIEIESESVLAT
jgi:hypothetical protein